MKVLVVLKSMCSGKTFFRPSVILGLLLFIIILSFGLFVGWMTCWPKITFFKQPPPLFNATNWLFLIGAFSAMVGWIVSSMVTIRNSIKQHTINTLLQSRLSATYMEKAKFINKTFFTPEGKLLPFSKEDITNTEKEEEREALTYVLNYFEFIAVGIRHGDFDEAVMKQTLRGILVNAYLFSEAYIKQGRGEENGKVTKPKVLEHLTWLYHRWK